LAHLKGALYMLIEINFINDDETDKTVVNFSSEFDDLDYISQIDILQDVVDLIEDKYIELYKQEISEDQYEIVDLDQLDLEKDNEADVLYMKDFKKD
jgi:hypothetical protein